MTDTHTIPATQSDADRALKQKHRAMWASGDYPRLASELIWRLGPRLVAATAVQPGERVLDIAAGSGNVAIPAALHGATSSTRSPGCTADAATSRGPSRQMSSLASRG